MYLIVAIGIAIIYSCHPAEKSMQRGQYGAAVEKAITKLRKKPTSEKELAVLKTAYPLANQQNMDRINYLKQEGNPNSWDEIFKIYSILKRRQSLVKTIVPIISAEAFSFREIDYDAEMVQAKIKAADYYYTNGKKLMENNDKLSFRKAYSQFLKAKKYTSDYTDIDQLIKQAREKGTSHVLVGVKNETRFKLSTSYKNNLIAFGTSKINDEWIKYYTANKRGSQGYDYDVNVVLKKMDISPEREKENTFTERKKVQDGWKYLLDEKGNVKKDTLGNDLKEKKFKTITCNVIESLQEKSIRINGVVDYINNQTKQSMQQKPISSVYTFKHSCRSANGDRNALSQKTRQSLGNKPVAFPTDQEMIDRASKQLQSSIYKVLKFSKNYLK